MSMNSFLSHLTELKRFDRSLVESVITNYKSIFESDDVKTRILAIKCRDRDNHLRTILDFVASNTLSGNFIVDPESEKPTLIRMLAVRDSEKITVDKNEVDGDVVFNVSVTSTNDERIEMIKTLVRTFGEYGNCGHSFGSQFIPLGRCKPRQFCWDGDGADYIDTKSLKIT